MRILVVSNFYPPHFVGGYELGCRDIVDLLRQRGYEILVLTSIHGVPRPTDERSEPGVRRQLRFEGIGEPGYSPGRFVRESCNRRVYRATLAAFRPDLVYFFNQARLPGSLVRLTREAGVPYVFYLSDHSFLDWRVDSFWRRWVYPESTQKLKAAVKSLARMLLKRLSLLEDENQRSYRPRQFTSRYLQGLSRTAPDALDRVIPWSVALQCFPGRPASGAKPRRLLYVGQIEPHKGTLTALQAVALLRRQPGLADISLTVVGSASLPDYAAELHTFISTENLAGMVRFTGKLERREVLALYQQHDILIFPSVWEEPFAITPLEAMASGLAVVGTATGGSREIFEQRRNAMIFAPHDAAGCAEAVVTLANDSPLYRLLCENGRRLVEEKYSLGRMVTSIEQHLHEVLEGAAHRALASAGP